MFIYKKKGGSKQVGESSIGSSYILKRKALFITLLTIDNELYSLQFALTAK
jgi:hypothetical protein